jgi:hypothetical protein
MHTEFLLVKPEVKRPLERPRNRWKHNIRTNLGKKGCEVVDREYVAQNRDKLCALVSTVKKICFPLQEGNYFTS